MLNPILYLNGNNTQRNDAMEMVPTYLELVKWRGTADETVLDVGCGTGDVTWEILKPQLPSAACVFGADIAPDMIAYAAKTYPDLEFFVLDIGTKHLPYCWITTFDHIFSFYCLHWVQDQRQALQNIYKMLKPKGDLFMYYLASHPFYDAFFNTSQLTKWRHYIPDEEAYKNVSVHQHDDPEDVEKRMNDILIDVNFKVSLCKVIKKQFVNTLGELKIHLKGIHAHYAKIPTNLREDLIDDTLQELFKLKSYRDTNPCDNFNEIVISYTLIVIVATKDNTK